MTRRVLAIWLVSVGLLLAVFGVVMAALNDTQAFRMIFDREAEQYFWSGSLPAEAGRFRAWVYGAWGGTVSGFGLLFAVVAKPAITAGNEHLRLGALAALTVWFVVDSIASIFHGPWGNAVFVNLPVFLALGLPLMLAGSRKDHSRER